MGKIRNVHSKYRIFVIFSVIGISISLFITLGLHETYMKTYAQTESKTSESQIMNNYSKVRNIEMEKDPFYSEDTKSTNMRVLSVNPVPKLEITYNGNSTINGTPTQTIGTIVDTMDENGAVHSKGKAIILSSSGDIITYQLESIGHYNADGSFSDSGVMSFNLPFLNNDNDSNSNATDKTMTNSLMEFKNLLGIYKKTVDSDGNGKTQVWKWG